MKKLYISALSISKQWIVKLINCSFLFFMLSFFVVFHAEAFDYSTVEVDYAIMHAFAGQKTGNFKRVVNKARMSLTDQVSGESPAFKNAYLVNLDFLLKGKAELRNIGLELATADWRDMKTLKSADYFKDGIDRFAGLRNFDPGALKRINSMLLIKIQAVSQISHGHYLYLDVDRASLPRKPELLVFDTNRYNFSVIANKDYRATYDATIGSGHHAQKTTPQDDFNDRIGHYSQPGTSGSVEGKAKYIVHVYVTNSMEYDLLNRDRFGWYTKVMCKELSRFEDNSSLYFVSKNQAVINHYEKYFKGFPHYLINYLHQKDALKKDKIILYKVEDGNYIIRKECSQKTRTTLSQCVQDVTEYIKTLD